MANYYICLLLFRIILPVILTTCVVIRPSAISGLYLLLLLILPLLPIPTATSMKGSTGLYLKILVATAFLTSLAQLSFQIVLLSMPPYGAFLENTPLLEKILRHVGLVTLDQLDPIPVITWLLPEVLILIGSLVTYILCKKFSMRTNPDATEDGVQVLPKSKPEKKPFGLLVAMGKYAVLAALCLAAVFRPSVSGGLYFMVFLATATWWSCYKQLGKGFAITMKALMVYVVAHIWVLYAYQFEWPQELLQANSTYARYFGLTDILQPDPEDPRVLIMGDYQWDALVNPFVILLLYYVLALESKFLLMPQSQSKQGPFSRLDGSINSGSMARQMSHRLSANRTLMRSATTKTKWQNATRKVRTSTGRLSSVGESTPLIRGVSPTSSKRYGSSHKRGSSMMQDSTGSVTVTGDNPEDIQMDELGTIEDEYVPTVCEHIMFALESILQMIIKSSYIGTNIIMMAWSITYLSWITFVLLIWANLLWLVPNQRQSMLRSSPFLVIYAWFLLISAYIYSMDLTEEELPSVIQGINLSQIGFHKVTVLPCTRLLVKCLFTAMFWITLRQFMQERRAARQSSALADMVAPLQVTVGTAAGVSDEPEHGSLLMERLGQWLVRFLTKFWIWGVAITLFVVAITGQRMTVFRILYMALFLFFVLSFQLSFRAWRKMMVGFWLTVIVYSMIMLVLVYTYQFDNFQEYWRDYLHIPIQQQLDIGLEKFETKQLFVRLVTPTFFVIITVIQLHYFHKDFMELSDPKNTSPIGVELDESSLQGGVAPANSDLDETNTSSLRYDFTDSNLWGSERRKYILNYLQHVLNLVFIFLELHMPKLVLLFLMLLCVYDKCALNLVQIVLIVLAFTFGRPMQIFAIYCSSIFVSFMLLARMIYQIDYIEPGYWNVTCDNGNTTEVENNANWLGFNKTMDGVTLPILVQWNIVYILVVTLWAVILVRQFNYRVSKGRPTTRAFFMFPKVTRADADQDLSHCLKYLANYGFYKFGVEICFMVTVALIGFRMDMYASIYSIWLCILFNRKRSTLASIWNMFLAFIAISLVIQYVLAVGLPPTLCVVFPWDFSYWGDMTHAQMFRRLQDWAFLLDDDNPPSATKLICDFVLLLLVSRQSVVFRIEKRYAHQEYPGGSNESILHHAEEPNFVNPVPDFISYVQSYLDVLKRLFLSSFLWITLALVFLAGTNRVNLFSIGYLGGAFIFLWQGSDLYLRPIPKILKAWDYLLAYNVFVIMIKTILQIVGCIFLYQIPKTSCWPIQLFGIGCVNKFGSLAEQTVQADSNECVVPREFVGLAWDGFCFGFLIMQRRIFNSYNFFHMIDESKATTILASRGAVLIEELRQKRMVEQEDTERKVLEKIKTKMDKIKANQQRIQGASYKDTTNHFIDSIFPRAKGGRRRVPKTYKAAIRSGDYYMFDDLDDDDDLALIDELEQDDKYARERGRTVSELLRTAMRSDIGRTVRGHSEYEFRRRSSIATSLLSRQKSIVSNRSQLSVPFSAPPTIEEHVRKNVTIASPSEEEPQPGTSKDEDISDLDEPKLSLRQKFINFIIFIWFFINSSMISLTLFFNKYSKDYRYVMRVLTKEKKVLKENTDYQTGLRVGPGQVWQPAASYHSLLRHSREESPLSAGTFSPSDSYRLALLDERMGLDTVDEEKAPVSDESDMKAQPITSPYSTERDSELDPAADLEDYEAAEMSSYDQPAICRLLLAIWYLGMSRSDWFCYVVIFLNQIKSATFLSLPLPLMVFLWGTLTIPRPSKNFWVTIIAYTEVIVLIKCMFQFELIPWNMNQSNTNNPFHPPRIIGIERTKTYAVWDLILLLVVFFHRFMLKSMGLWTDSIVPAALVGSGQYRVTADGDLVRITSNQRIPEKPSSYIHPQKFKTISGYNRNLKSMFKKLMHRKEIRTSEENSPATTRRPSDLQRLVEDSEEPEEETYDLRKSAKLETDLANKIVIVETEIVNPLEHFPQAFQIATLKYVSAMKTFFVQLRDPTSRVAADVYSYMFLCDFFNFFVILMGYSAFGTQQGDGGVSSYLEDDRVPVLFLLMLILQFLLIIVDRGIFLRKNILAKILFQFIQVFILHIWLFIVFPLITERGFNSVLPPQMYYMVKCFYLLLSAYQIRCGYPTRILGNFLCKGYNYVNMFLFKTFMAIPFLFELRTVMDWMWTDTSMTVFDWIKMEDIFAHIFQLKCSRHVEDEYPQPRGEKKNPAVKYAMGGAILFVIIAIIWFPLVFFSLGNAVGQPNPPYDVTMEIRIGPYAPVYQMSAQSNSIYSFTESNMEQMRQVYVQKKYAATFISNYVAGDVAAVKLSSDSANTWSISPPDRQKMVDEVESSNPLSVRLEYKVSHKTSKPEDSGVIPDNVEFIIPAGSAQSPNPARESLRKMLTDRGGYAGSMLLSHIMPKFLKVTNRGTAKAVSQLMFTKTGEPVTQRSINLSLNKSVDPSGNNKEWWNIQENCDDTNYEQYLSKLPYADCNSIMMYTFNDKIFPSTLNIFTGGGIVGLYTTLVFVASRFLRGFFADQCFKIMFEDMPNIDRVLQLCLDIYLVREAREFTLEEDLFAKLVFLFRSPETLIKWTRPKEEVGDDEDPEGVDA